MASFLDLPKLEYDDSGKFDDWTAEQHLEYQTDARGPVPTEFQLAPRDRHVMGGSDVEWIADVPELIAANVPDNAGPAFCSFSKVVFGTYGKLAEFFDIEDALHIESAKKSNARYETEEEIAEAKDKGQWRDEKGVLRERFDQALSGEQSVWACYGGTTILADDAPKVHAHAKVCEHDMMYIHYNIWKWVSTFRAREVEADVIWVTFVPNSHVRWDLPIGVDEGSAEYSNAMANSIGPDDERPDPIYARIIQMRAEDASRCYFGRSGMFDYEEDDGFDQTPWFESRLHVIEKTFDSEEEMMEDAESFSPSDIDYSRIFRSINSDG